MSECASAARRLCTAFVVPLVLIVGACERRPTEPEPPANQVTNGAFSATIGGTPWTAVGQVSVKRPSAGVVNISAVSPTFTVQINLGGVSVPGVFPLGGPSILVSSGSVMANDGSRWITTGIGAIGSVTLTTVTDSRIAGTFAFVGAPVGSPMTLMDVSKGTFDVTY